MQLWLGLVVALVACNSAHATVDAPVTDRPTQQLDAMPDSPPDSPAAVSTSPRCTTTPTMLIDTSPRVIGNIARAGDTLYVSAYQQDNQTITDPVVIPIDLTTGVAAAPFTLAGAAAVWPAGDYVYADEFIADGTIWQLHPGSAPVPLIQHLASPAALTADADYVYWAEGDAVKRRAIAGGAVEPVMTCANPGRLLVDATDIYCTTNGYVLRALKAGGSIPDGIAGLDSYPITSMIMDGTYLYFVNLDPYADLYEINTFGSSATLVKKLTQPGGRYDGLAVTNDYFYITDDSFGMRRINRTTTDVEVIVPGPGYEQDPVLWHDQLYYEAQNPQLSFDRYVMHCVD